ncbi:MAG: hypothetical protein AB8G96_14520 [Phycisphaerales bacterium]
MSAPPPELIKRIRKKLKDNKAITDASYPPQLAGSNATDFIDNANDAKSNATDALADSLFAGITPAPPTQPGGVAMIDWFVDMADLTVATVASGPNQDLQACANNLQGIAGNTASLITSYT